MTPISLGISGSSAASSGVTAPFTVTTGKSNTTLYLVLAALALVALVFWFRRR